MGVATRASREADWTFGIRHRARVFLALLCVMYLQEVSLRRCTKVTSVGLAALTLSGSLRSLNVSGIAAVGPPVMKALADSCS